MDLPRRLEYHGGPGDSLSTTGTGSSFVNQTTITVSGVSLAVNTSVFTNQGTLNPVSGGTLAFTGSFRVNDPGIISGDSTGRVTVGGVCWAIRATPANSPPRAKSSFPARARRPIRNNWRP